MTPQDSDPITIITELADVQDQDHNWLVELHNDPEVLHNVTDPRPITIEGHIRWWKSLNPTREIRKVFLVNGTRAGFCKFYQVDSINANCVLGADLHKDFRGKGFSYMMWQAMLDFCFKQLQMHRVSLTTASYNHVAQHVYTKMGFKEEGRRVQSLFRDGRFHDEICMYMLRDHFLKG